MKELLISFDCDPNSYILLGVFNCHGVSSRGTGGGVCNCTLRRLRTTCVLIGTSLDALKAF